MSSDKELVDRSLGRLDRVASASWREPHEVKRTAVRRRRGRFAALGVSGLAVATAIALSVALPGPSSSPVPIAQLPSNGARIGTATQLVANVKPLTVTSGSADEQAVVRAEQAFTFALLKQVNAGGGAGNVVLSPSSLAIALAMLENGAGGKTKHEIATVLRTSGLTDTQLNSGCAALSADLGASGVLDSANSLWLQHGAPMGQAFMDAMARYFRTGVWQVDFFHDFGGATSAINAWVTKQTHGRITKLFNKGDIDPSTLLVLANAVYFKAAWKTAFDPKHTHDAQFHTADGKTVTAPFMKRDGGLSVSQSDDSVAVQLPYADGRYVALAIMPTSQSLADFVGRLTPAALDRITGGLQPDSQDVLLPKFTISEYTKLNATLAAMGMPTAFDPSSADLSPMSPRAGYVQSVVQRAYLKVDEKGTEAAAVTGIGVAPTAAVMPLTFDHPFLFLVRDTKTGAIVFSAQVQDPTT
ncbi:MAG: serpin family protein [Jatrophihabitantaceae bacterium]